MYTSIEICAGAGGQALGLERAGFRHLALVEYEKAYCECLRANRPAWDVLWRDVTALGNRKAAAESPRPACKMQTLTIPDEYGVNHSQSAKARRLNIAKSIKDCV